MSDVQDQLRRLLHRCVTHHVHQAHQAYALCQVIGEHSWTITRDGFAPLFTVLQLSLADEMVLSLTKLLESGGSSYSRRSIPTVLDYVEQHAGELNIADRARLEAVVTSDQEFDADSGIPGEDELLTRAAVAALRKTLPKPKALWVRRNKRIAHSEDADVPESLRARWDEAQSLIEFAQRFAATIGASFGVFVFEANDGTYMLSEAAKEMSRRLEDLLSRADLLDSQRGKRPRIEYRGFVAEAEERRGFWLARVLDVDEPVVATGRSLEGVTQELHREIDKHVHGS